MPIDDALMIGRDLGLTTGNQNRAFHKKANLAGAGGSPKDTSMGKDLSRDATNTIGGTQVSTTPISPNANANSRNGA